MSPDYFDLEDKSKLYRNLYFLANISEWYEHEKDEDIKKLIESFNEFAKYTHCLANMILVPEGYNTGRYCKTKDYWDLSLMDLQKKYTEENFKKYIQAFFLDDWVEEKEINEIKKLTVKLLFKGHDPASNSYRILCCTSRDKEDLLDKITKLGYENWVAGFQECVSKINKRIEEKGERMRKEYQQWQIEKEKKMSC